MNSFRTIIFFLIGLYIIFSGNAFFLIAQTVTKEEENVQKESIQVQNPPLGLENKKRISAEDLIVKKEGLYFTGLPLVNSDPNTGIGYGVRVYAYENGSKKSPFFPYTPYRQRLFAQFFQTTGGWSYHTLDYDAPYIFGTLFRLRSALVYDRDTNKNFFGIGEYTLSKLNYKGMEYDKMADYLDDLKKIDPVTGKTRTLYNKYDLSKPNWNTSLEYDLFGGIIRAQAGFMIRKISIKDYTGKNSSGLDTNNLELDTANDKTLLYELNEKNHIKGFKGGWNNYYKLGLALDTRDFEPDPRNGVFMDVSLETTGPQNLSDYSYNRITFSPRFYYSPIPSYQKLTLAMRWVYTFLAGDNIPFYAYNTISFTDGDQDGLGGYRTLRGFVDSRFMGKAMSIFNFEIRERMFVLSGAGQSFNFILVPFVDFGRVFDEVDRTNTKNWKVGYGAGLRLAWNQATIIMIDLGFSQESSALLEGLYINFNHIF